MGLPSTCGTQARTHTQKRVVTSHFAHREHKTLRMCLLWPLEEAEMVAGDADEEESQAGTLIKGHAFCMRVGRGLRTVWGLQHEQH